MTGRRSHGRLSALNGVVHQGSRNPLSPARRTKGAAATEAMKAFPKYTRFGWSSG